MDYQAHLFICANDRGPDGKRPRCVHRGAEEPRAGVKEAVNGDA